MEGTEDEYPVGLFDWRAIGAGHFGEFFKTFAAGDHVDDVASDLDDELLWEDDPWA